MTMIAYAFLQHRRLPATAPKKRESMGAPASANFESGLSRKGSKIEVI
jgi:hypothetical protein